MRLKYEAETDTAKYWSSRKARLTAMFLFRYITALYSAWALYPLKRALYNAPCSCRGVIFNSIIPIKYDGVIDNAIIFMTGGGTRYIAGRYIAGSGHDLITVVAQFIGAEYNQFFWFLI